MKRIIEIERGRYQKVLERLTQMDVEKLMKFYVLKDQEPQDNLEWVPKNPNFPEDIGEIVLAGC